jgi:hypothetical protein
MSDRTGDGIVPLGWPAEVPPPGAPGWDDVAGRWLLDLCPPEYRGYSGLRRHLVVLARFAVLHVEGMQTAVRRGLSEGRTSLRDVADPDVVERAMATWACEEARLSAVRRSAGLVEEALRGRRFRARL